jgi:para-nitrobenzyl esterase
MRRSFLIFVVVCLVIVTAGCDLRLAVPQGEAPLRYRDEVFTGVTKTSDVTYGSAVNQSGQNVTLLLDVYEPTGDTVDARPAIVWVHGGSFAFGNKSSPEIVDEANTFARKGYVTVSIDYRLNNPGCTTVTAACITAIVDAKHDAQAAVRYLRANAATLGIDPGRIAIGGSSAGAITALNVGYGPEDVGISGNPGFDSTVGAAVSLSGAALTTVPNPGEAAGLLFHGTADGLVQYQWALNTEAAATDAGLTVYLTTWEGQGHVPYATNRTQIINETTNFLYWTLNLGTAAA